MAVQGLTSQLIRGLGAVSEDVKLLLSRLLTVPPSLRITAEEAAGSPWLTSEGALATVDFSPFKEWSAASQLALADQVKNRLGLSHLGPQQVLDYIVSPRGHLGKTFGCYSLLGGDSRTRAGTVAGSKVTPPPSW